MAHPTAAARWLAVGGLLIVLGSMDAWRICNDTSCGEGGGGFLVITPESGLILGPGILTDLAGLVLIWLGISAARARGRTPFRSTGIALAGASVAITAAVIPTIVRPELRFPPVMLGTGPFVVIVGGLISAVAARRLRPRRRRPIHEARLAAVLAAAGFVLLVQLSLRVWGAGPGPTALAYASVLFALAVTIRPAHRPNRRLVAGLTTVLLTGGVYVAIHVGLAATWLLFVAWLPLALHAALGWSSAPEATAWEVTPVAVLVGAAGVVGGVMLSVALRSAGILEPLPHLSAFDPARLIERPLEFLLAFGVAILAGLGVAIGSELATRRRPG